jgi:hypothetical protein
VETSKGGTPIPLFFVSVAATGVSRAASLLFATLAGRSVSVAAKGVRGANCWRESNGHGYDDFEGVRRTAWRAPMIGEARVNRADVIHTL